MLAGILTVLYTQAMIFAWILFRAFLMCWPAMIFFGAVHSYIDFVPALGLRETFLVLALLGTLLPASTTLTGSKSTDD